jgi:hypothetical protein
VKITDFKGRDKRIAMEWLRWYHGCVTDPKFPLIARRSGQNVASVLAVWCAMLERASQAQDRGSVEGFDCESFDALFGLNDGACQSIVAALESKGMIVDGRIAKWEERQGKDETATERKRLQREREKLSQEKAELEALKASCHGMSRDVTDGHAMSLRRDEIREEKNINTPPIAKPPCARVDAPLPEEEGGGGDFCAGRDGPRKTDCPSKGNPEWPAFQSCYGVYPVKQGMEEAWREWMRLKQNGTLGPAYAIRDAILRLSAEDSRWKRGKVPKMAKWLNGKGWEDEPYVEPADGISGILQEPQPETEAQRVARKKREEEEFQRFTAQARKKSFEGLPQRGVAP